MKWETLEQAVSNNLSEFRSFAQQLNGKLGARAVLVFSGPMGAGKTEMVKALCLSFGVQGVVSPTYALHHSYQSAGMEIDHFDLYRMKSESELETTGFWDLFSEDRGLILIEWPERMRLEDIPNSWDLFRVEIELFQNRPESRGLVLSKARR